MYYPFMDYYITELTARLLENDGRYQAQYLIPMNLPRLTPDTVDFIFDTYKTDLRCDIARNDGYFAHLHISKMATPGRLQFSYDL